MRCDKITISTSVVRNCLPRWVQFIAGIFRQYSIAYQFSFRKLLQGDDRKNGEIRYIFGGDLEVIDWSCERIGKSNVKSKMKNYRPQVIHSHSTFNVVRLRNRTNKTRAALHSYETAEKINVKTGIMLAPSHSLAYVRYSNSFRVAVRSSEIHFCHRPLGPSRMK